jgi:hypothetical protein
MRTIYVAILFLGLGLGLIQVLRYICFSTDESKTILMVSQSGMY